MYQVKKMFQDVFTEIAKKEMSQSGNTVKNDVSHVVMWVGDLMVIYVKRAQIGKDLIRMELHLP